MSQRRRRSSMRAPAGVRALGPNRASLAPSMTKANQMKAADFDEKFGAEK